MRDVFQSGVAVMVICAVGCPCGSSCHSVIANGAGDAHGADVNIEVAELRSGFASIAVPTRGEVVATKNLCPRDAENEVSAAAWTGALEKQGFEVQVNTGGWTGRGPLALRFRRAHLVGDLWGNGADGSGCRTYTIRFQYVGTNVPLRWEAPFGDAVLARLSSRCIRFFSPDSRFPFVASAYEWGCR